MCNGSVPRPSDVVVMELANLEKAWRIIAASLDLDPCCFMVDLLKAYGRDLENTLHVLATNHTSQTPARMLPSWEPGMFLSCALKACEWNQDDGQSEWDVFSSVVHSDLLIELPACSHTKAFLARMIVAVVCASSKSFALFSEDGKVCKETLARMDGIFRDRRCMLQLATLLMVDPKTALDEMPRS